MTFQIDPIVVIAILGVVNLIKSTGLQGNILTVISMAVGVALYVVVKVLPPDVAQVIIGGIIAGLGASGFYDFGKMFSQVKA